MCLQKGIRGVIRCNVMMCDTPPHVLLSAQYESNSLVTDMLFDVILGLECDVVIGCEWISLCRMVTANFTLLL